MTSSRREKTSLRIKSSLIHPRTCESASRSRASRRETFFPLVPSDLWATQEGTGAKEIS
jgi:hypothetical protein